MIGADRLEFQRVAPRLAAGLTLGASALVGGCTAPPSYMGLNLNASDLPAEPRDLALRAQAGDKEAQLYLGIAFEEGRGVARDLGRARRLYALATSCSGGLLRVYVLLVIPSQAGRVTQVPMMAPPSGFTNTKARLEQLNEMK